MHVRAGTNMVELVKLDTCYTRYSSFHVHAVGRYYAERNLVPFQLLPVVW